MPIKKMGKYASRVGGRIIAAQRKKWLIAIIIVMMLVGLLALFAGVFSGSPAP